MTLTINRAALTTDTFRSAALGPLDSIAHPLAPDNYSGEVWLGDKMVGTFTIDAAEGGSGEQVDIDLSEIADGSAKQVTHFSLGLIEQTTAFVVFHCGGDASGFHVLLRSRSGLEPYDTRRMQLGDYYITTPIKPGRYAMKANGDNQDESGVLLVDQAQPTDAPHPSANGAMIVVKGGFEPAEVHIASGDGAVFQIAAADTDIELTLAPTDQNRESRRPIHIRYPGRRP